MKSLTHILLFAVLTASSVPALAQSEVISGLPGIDGISPILQVPAADPALTNGLFGEDLIDLPLLQKQIEIPDPVSGGLPGIDGLNFSPEALRKAFQGIDPALVRSVLGGSDPQLIQQITQDLSAELPGLGEPGNEQPQTLPGLDGLPVDLPE